MTHLIDMSGSHCIAYAENTVDFLGCLYCKVTFTYKQHNLFTNCAVVELIRIKLLGIGKTSTYLYNV